MDIKKNWRKYNIKAIKTVQALKISKYNINSFRRIVFVVYTVVSFIVIIFSLPFRADFTPIVSGIFGSMIGDGVFRAMIVGGIIGGIVGVILAAIFGPILKNIKNTGLKYDTDPKFLDSKKKAKKILTKMCEAGNFIGFEKLYPQLPLSMVKSWHGEIIQNKNYQSIAYALLLDNKIFHDYIKQNDVSVSTIEALIELDMDLEMFKSDSTLLSKSSDETKNAIATALINNDSIDDSSDDV